MKLEVFNKQGISTGRMVDLPDAIFGIEPNEHAVYLAVKQYLANQRQGTHKSKERSEVARSTRKLFRQKGTGGARRGDMKSPIVKGGGTVFGPQPRDYSQKLNKKVKLLARKSALSSRAKQGQVTVVENFSIATPKTKEFAAILNNLKATDKKTLIITPELDKNVYLSARNISKASVAVAKDLHTYQIMNSSALIIEESAIEKIIETFA